MIQWAEDGDDAEIFATFQAAKELSCAQPRQRTDSAGQRNVSMEVSPLKKRAKRKPQEEDTPRPSLKRSTFTPPYQMVRMEIPLMFLCGDCTKKKSPVGRVEGGRVIKIFMCDKCTDANNSMKHTYTSHILAKDTRDFYV